MTIVCLKVVNLSLAQKVIQIDCYGETDFLLVSKIYKEAS